MSPSESPEWLARHGRKATPRPFLKWAGGKTQLLKRLHTRLPKKFNTYHEPFLGSGALYFFLLREGKLKRGAQLSDINPNLMGAWRAIQEDVDGVIAALRAHRNEHDYFYEVRAQDPAQLTQTQQAARMIFLNRTCYNGLYRENSSGRFNVPYGRYVRPNICDEPNLRAVSEALRQVTLVESGFAEALDSVKEGDFVYLDPPYQPRSPTSYFTAYHRSGFGEDQQERLRATLDDLHKRGALVMLSNSDTDYITKLYDGDHLRADIVMARRNINRNASARGEIREVIVRNY